MMAFEFKSISISFLLRSKILNMNNLSSFFKMENDLQYKQLRIH